MVAAPPSSNDVTTPARLDVTEDPSGHLRFTLGGDWLLGQSHPSAQELVARLDSGGKIDAVAFDTRGLGAWDTALVTFLAAVEQSARTANIPIDHAGLPEGARKLLQLAFAVGERKGARRSTEHKGVLTRTGQRYLAAVAGLRERAEFLGDFSIALIRFFTGRANYQRSDLAVTIQESGAEALGIISLISFLIGMIFAFVGVRQLEQFGAGIFVADLVAVGMIREMGPIMTGILMAGRTGAAFAASIGTMKVNEEIDALTTLGLDPMEFLVLPRVLALVLMLPLLVLYANAVGILGGMVVALAMLDVSIAQYWVQTINSVTMTSVVTGLIKAVTYGIVVALAGCRNGLECGNSAQAVGLATTSAVVSGIVWIIVTASVLTIIYITLGV